MSCPSTQLPHIDLPGEENNSLGYWVQPRTTFAVEGDVVWYRTGTPPTQSLDIELTLGENNLEASVVNGTFGGIAVGSSPGRNLRSLW